MWRFEPKSLTDTANQRPTFYVENPQNEANRLQTSADLVAEQSALRDLLAAFSREMRDKHDRRVPVGDLLTDRWEIAKQYGFGEGTSCYDNVLIRGDVKVGSNVWIGPNCILDGTGGLTIGDHVDLSAGVQIYTHHTVARVTTGAEIEYAPTKIGSHVYIGPQTVIQKGVTIGDGVVIGAMSLVTRDIPDGARAWGIPARIQ